LSVPTERELADAIRDGAARDAEQRGTGRYRGTVLSTGPLRIDVHALDLTLEPADLTLTRTVGPLTVGDVVVVIEVDEDEWSVLAVERSDDDPEPAEMATQAELDALAASTDSRLDALEVAPEPVHYVGDSSDPIAPAFLNSWVNYDNALATPSAPRNRSVGFYKWGGRVWLSGVMKTGASGTSAFTLPVGYRPAHDSGDMLAFAGSAYGLVTPMADGRLLASSLTGNVTTFVELFGLSFRHA
jgi:hypothetical protein